MSKMTILEKLKVILDVTKSSNLYIIVILILIALGLGLSMSNPKNQNKQKLTYIILTIFITAFSIFSYHSSIGNMFSYMMDNLFIVVFFPNLAVYLAAIVITNIILWVSIFGFKSSKQIRNLNIVVYSVITYLMLLLLNIINENKLDIFSQQSVYGNKQASALIDISSFIFVIWIIFLVIYKIILMYIKKNYAPNVKKVVIKKKVKILPENYQPLDVPDYVYGTVRKKQTSLVELENRFSLEDYKLFSKILKEEKNKVVEYKENTKEENLKSTIEDSIKNIIDDSNTQNEEEYTYEDFTKSNDENIYTQEEPVSSIEKDEIFQDYEEFNKVTYEEEYQNPIDEITNFDDTDDNKFFVEKDYTAENDDQERENSKYTELELLYRGIN